MSDVVILPAIFFVSLVTVVLIFDTTKKFLIRVGLMDIDQQKKGRPRLPTSGGLVVIIGILSGIFFYIGINTFLLHAEINLSYILAGAFSILIITLIGFFDDIAMSPTPNVDKGIKTYRVGIKQWQKALFTLPAAVPLMAVSAGTTLSVLPFLDLVDFGILYPLVIIPLAVVCVSNATNMLAGMNGLEAGLGTVALASLGIFSFMIGQPEASAISFIAVGALLGFLIWNKYPARILPGDSLTYLIGAVIVTVVVLGNMEKFGIIIFAPWIIEAFLKLRASFGARSLGDLQPDGTLKAPYKQTYSLTHVVMKIRPFREWQVAAILILFEAFICIAAFALLLPAALA